MCHEFHGRAWHGERTSDEGDEESTPSFLNDEPAEDVELLTDGGDE